MNSYHCNKINDHIGNVNILSIVGSVLPFIVLVSILSCSKVNKYHVQEWQSAFFLNDSTLGVIGWDYDLDESSDILSETDFKNVKQTYYHYNLNSGSLSTAFTLSKHELSPEYHYYTSFNHPWIYYSTKTGQGFTEIGLYNLETNENKLFKSEAGYRGRYPLVVSNRGRYLGYRYSGHPDYSYSIYDLQNNKDIFNSFLHRPLYINDSASTVLFLYPVNTQKYFLKYNMSTKVMDTLCENDFGFIDFHSTNNITVFHKEGVWKYFINEEFVNGTFNDYVLTNLEMGKKGTCHINLNLGKAVFSTNSIYIANYKESRKPYTILNYSKVER